jgi:acyl carrier protein
MDVIETLRSVIHEIVGTPMEKIAPDSSISELVEDPFDREELLLDIENRFDVLIPETDVATVGDLAKLVIAA